MELEWGLMLLVLLGRRDRRGQTRKKVNENLSIKFHFY
jgi:hypothetical protein